jgi:hypothetical protein
VGVAVEAMHSERCEVPIVLAGLARLARQMAPDIPGVQADQHDRDDPPPDEQVRRQERGPDGQRVADEEVAQIV